jgi:hypothetical protein
MLSGQPFGGLLEIKGLVENFGILYILTLVVKYRRFEILYLCHMRERRKSCFEGS